MEVPYTPSTMKRLLLFCSTLLLAGCVQADTGFTLTFTDAGQERKQELIDTATRVITRRLEPLGQQMRGKKVRQTADGAVLRFSLPNPAHRVTIENQLTAPLEFRVMVEAPREQADIWNDQAGGYRSTGITEKDVAWAYATTSEDGKTGKVLLTFTDEGQTLFGLALQENQGKKLGIFVRGTLVTYKRIGPQDQKTGIPIDNIPGFALASVFADDVNVGAHVAFTPLNATAKQASSAAATLSSAASVVSSASGSAVQTTGTSSVVPNP